MVSCVVALIELLGVFVAGWLLYHTLNTWLQVQRPRISVTLETCRRGLLILAVRNTGSSAAHNVRMSLDEPLLDNENRDIGHRYAFRMGVPVLPAGQGVSYPINNVTAFFRGIDGDKATEECRKTWTASVSYEWVPFRKRYSERIVVSADYLRGGLVPIKTVEESLAEIADDLKREQG